MAVSMLGHLFHVQAKGWGGLPEGSFGLPRRLRFCCCFRARTYVGGKGTRWRNSKARAHCRGWDYEAGDLLEWENVSLGGVDGNASNQFQVVRISTLAFGLAVAFFGLRWVPMVLRFVPFFMLVAFAFKLQRFNAKQLNEKVFWNWCVGRIQSALRMCFVGGEEDFPAVDKVLEELFRAQRKEERRLKEEGNTNALDVRAVHGCLSKLEGLVAKMKADQRQTAGFRDDLSKMEQELQTLKRLLLHGAPKLGFSHTTGNTMERKESSADEELPKGNSAAGPVSVDELKDLTKDGAVIEHHLNTGNSRVDEVLIRNSSEEIGASDLLRVNGNELSPDYQDEAVKERQGTPSFKVDEDMRSMAKPSSTRTSPEDVFNLKLEQAEGLLQEGQKALDGANDQVGVADNMLYEAAELLAKAVSTKPTSLIAVGMLANTLLVHGQLKLKANRQLREMLAAIKNKGMWEKRQHELETLQRVSQGCEDLLVEAGRTYRKALSIDRSDVRALHNWGLALCFRAQLISLEEDNEKAVQDADKVYLAAIDKFEALVAMDQAHAAAALLQWGIAVRDRSRLRAKGSAERINLLLQSKELLNDAARLDPDHAQVNAESCACKLELEEIQMYHRARRYWT